MLRFWSYRTSVHSQSQQEMRKNSEPDSNRKDCVMHSAQPNLLCNECGRDFFFLEAVGCKQDPIVLCRLEFVRNSKHNHVPVENLV